VKAPHLTDTPKAFIRSQGEDESLGTETFGAADGLTASIFLIEYWNI
jgi:hypothetical protein